MTNREHPLLSLTMESQQILDEDLKKILKIPPQNWEEYNSLLETAEKAMSLAMSIYNMAESWQAALSLVDLSANAVIHNEAEDQRNERKQSTDGDNQINKADKEEGGNMKIDDEEESGESTNEGDDEVMDSAENDYKEDDF